MLMGGMFAYGWTFVFRGVKHLHGGDVYNMAINIHRHFYVTLYGFWFIDVFLCSKYCNESKENIQNSQHEK